MRPNGSRRSAAAGEPRDTAELATRASGEALNPLHFRRHLEIRYLGQATV